MSKYADIIGLPHYEPKRHPRMRAADRAAQFSPFAALTGHDGAVKETARLTDRRIELSEDMLAAINDKLRQIQEQIAAQPEVSITYFVPDSRKAGGSYTTVTGKIKKFKDIERQIVMDDGLTIAFSEILEISI